VGVLVDIQEYLLYPLLIGEHQVIVTCEADKIYHYLVLHYRGLLVKDLNHVSNCFSDVENRVVQTKLSAVYPSEVHHAGYLVT